MVDAVEQPRSFAAIGGIGVAQLIGWGSLYYAIAVLADPLRHELRVAESAVFAGFAGALGVSGALAPWAGRLVDQYGGRFVLASGTLVGALGFMVLANAHTLWVCAFAFALHGIAMALGLYETCFAALAKQYPGAYRRAVTFVTLVAGLASSVFWPATHFVVSNVGWRAACWMLAALLLAAAVLNLLMFSPVHASAREASLPPREPGDAPKARGLIAAFAGVSFVSGVLAAHLPATLRALRLDPELAVWIAASVGIMQVVGRAVELSVRRAGSLCRSNACRARAGAVRVQRLGDSAGQWGRDNVCRADRGCFACDLRVRGTVEGGLKLLTTTLA